jgi:hypothetical protein
MRAAFWPPPPAIVNARDEREGEGGSSGGGGPGEIGTRYPRGREFPFLPFGALQPCLLRAYFAVSLRAMTNYVEEPRRQRNWSWLKHRAGTGAAAENPLGSNAKKSGQRVFSPPRGNPLMQMSSLTNSVLPQILASPLFVFRHFKLV